MEYHLYKSDKKDKKYMVKFMNHNTKQMNTIHFGAFGMSDFTIHKDPNRRQLYIIRHNKDKINNPNYAGFWSMNLLWNKPSLQSSIKDTEKQFSIKIVNKT